jgi:hypothetical protein
MPGTRGAVRCLASDRLLETFDGSHLLSREGAASLEGTLDECITAFMSKPISQHQLYEIYANLSRRW